MATYALGRFGKFNLNTIIWGRYISIWLYYIRKYHVMFITQLGGECSNKVTGGLLLREEGGGGVSFKFMNDLHGW